MAVLVMGGTRFVGLNIVETCSGAATARDADDVERAMAEHVVERLVHAAGHHRLARLLSRRPAQLRIPR